MQPDMALNAVAISGTGGVSAHEMLRHNAKWVRFGVVSETVVRFRFPSPLWSRLERRIEHPHVMRRYRPRSRENLIRYPLCRWFLRALDWFRCW